MKGERGEGKGDKEGKFLLHTSSFYCSTDPGY